MARSLSSLCILFMTLIPYTLSARVTNPIKVPKNAVLLSKVNSLTVRAGQQTASRRVSSVPQLQCVGQASICKLYSIDVMRCTNEGSGYTSEDIEWSCKASLPEEFKLGSTDVSCEGYESSDDPYVLKGSCGVEYKLLLTDKGEEKYGKPDKGGWNVNIGQTKSEVIVTNIFWIIFLGVLFIILYNLYKSYRTEGRRPGGGRPGHGGSGGGGGGGGGGFNNDPPPPYDPYPHDHTPPKKPRTSTPRTNTSSRASSSRNSAPWRPGFWTGAAAGGAAGYFAGNRNQTRTQPETQQRPAGGLFGGGGGRGGSSWTQQPSSASSSYTPSYSSSRHDSTGFGSTSRR